MRTVLRVYTLPVLAFIVGLSMAVWFGVHEFFTIRSWNDFVGGLRHGDSYAATVAIDKFRSAKPKEKYHTLIADGMISYKNGRYSQAVEFFRQAVQFAENANERSSALYNFSRAVVEAGIETGSAEAVEAALQILRESLRENPSNWRAKWNYEVLTRSEISKAQIKSESDGSNNQGSDKPEPKL